MKWLVGLIIILIIFGMIYVFSGGNTSYSPKTSPNPTFEQQPTKTSSSEPTSQIQSSKVSIENFSFNPSSTTIKVGTIVMWVNNDSVPHTVISDDGKFESSPIQSGETFSLKFDEAGDFPYYCSIHPSMRGTVVVEK